MIRPFFEQGIYKWPYYWNPRLKGGNGLYQNLGQEIRIFFFFFFLKLQN